MYILNIAKFAASLASTIVVSPLIVCCVFSQKASPSSNLFLPSAQLLSLVPTKVGIYLRSAFLRFTASNVKLSVSPGFLTLFSNHDLTIGEHVYIGAQCNIGTCHIGNNTLIGSGVHILSGKNQHNFDSTAKPIREQGGNLSKIRVGADCWIGNNSTILADIGEGVIVAAGAVVTHEFPDHAIVAGNPAKIIKFRS